MHFAPLVVNIRFPSQIPWLIFTFVIPDNSAMAFHGTAILLCYFFDCEETAQTVSSKGHAMGIFKTTLVLGAIFALMPSPPNTGAPTKGEAGQDPGAFGYAVAAVEAFSDVKGFCLRKPLVCDAAGHVAVKIEAKAKYSVRLIYEWANDAKAEVKQGAKDLDSVETGSIDMLEPLEISPNRES